MSNQNKLEIRVFVEKPIANILKRSHKSRLNKLEIRRHDKVGDISNVNTHQHHIED